MRDTSLLARIMISATLIYTASALFALEVDVDEVRTKRVNFINYRGKHRKIDPIKEVYEIGRKLGLRAKDNEQVRFHMKYSIVHAISQKEPEKFSADIFSIDRDARVDHIKNVRRIIIAYLQSMYGYSARNARTLSLFISYYNAVHRGDLQYFRTKYKSVVTNHINSKNAGISTKYWEWPGTTKMLIPLTKEAKRGQLDSIDPDVISDKETKDQIRKDDKNIPDRKDLADLKDRILDKDKKKLDEEKKELDKEKEKLDREKRKLDDEDKEIKKKEKELEREKEETKKIEDREKREEKEREIEKKEKDLDKEKEKRKEKDRDYKKREDRTKRKERQIDDKERSIKKREKDLDTEKKEIKKDELKKDIKEDEDEARRKLEEKEKELDKREDRLRDKELDKNIYGDKLYYLKIKEYLEGGHYNNDMYMINPSTRKILFKSPVENICGRRYDVFSGGVVVITHKGSHQSGHRLTLMDRETLEAKIYGTDNVFWRSFIEIREGFIYAILYDNGKHYLGRFDESLKLKAKSNIEISENTFISIYDNFIYINRNDKKIIVLKKDDLSFIGEVNP